MVSDIKHTSSFSSSVSLFAKILACFVGSGTAVPVHPNSVAQVCKVYLKCYLSHQEGQAVRGQACLVESDTKRRKTDLDGQPQWIPTVQHRHVQKVVSSSLACVHLHPVLRHFLRPFSDRLCLAEVLRIFGSPREAREEGAVVHIWWWPQHQGANKEHQ